MFLYPLVKKEVTDDNFDSYYSINTFKSLIHTIYSNHYEEFNNELLETGYYPKEHAQDDFFKEELDGNKGVIIDGIWFDSNFNETESRFYYFDSKKEYSIFKRIYKKHVLLFNKECYEVTSSIGKAFSSYGL